MVLLVFCEFLGDWVLLVVNRASTKACSSDGGGERGGTWDRGTGIGNQKEKGEKPPHKSGWNGLLRRERETRYRERKRERRIERQKKVFFFNITW